MVLDHDVLVVTAEVRLLNLAIQVIVRHRQVEVQAVVHIVHARFRLALAVELAREQTVGEYVSGHVLGIAANGDCGEEEENESKKAKLIKKKLKVR